jgi:hypothetical protein
MHINKQSGNSLVGTIFSLVALLLLSIGTLHILGYLFGSFNERPQRVTPIHAAVDVDQIAAERL